MQAIVADIVDRFVSTEAQNHGFGLRIITLKNPNWRTRALPLLSPIPVQSPGVQGWIMAREDAALLLSELRRRTDYREQTTPIKWSSTARRRSSRPCGAHVFEGHRPDLRRLARLPARDGTNRRRLHAGVQPAAVDRRPHDRRGGEAQPHAGREDAPRAARGPSTIAQNQHAQIEVPQLTMVQLHERFRWPTDHVLLLSMGVVATPGPEAANPVTDMIPMLKSAPRADALLMVESTGTVAQSTPPPARPSPTNGQSPRPHVPRAVLGPSGRGFPSRERPQGESRLP